MPSAKRPVRKSNSSAKPKVASPLKSPAGRKPAGKAALKPAARKAKPAKPAPAKKAGKVSKGKATPARPGNKAAHKPAAKGPKSTKSGKPIATKAATPAAKAQAAKVQAAKAGTAGNPVVNGRSAKPQAPALREMVVRTTPGLMKANGRKPQRSQDGARRTPDRYDPNALIHGIKPYRAQPGEAYMSPAQLDHFRQILLAWRRELMEEVDRTVHHMQDEASNFPDPNDRATQESEFGLELRTRDRERKLLKKIDAALERIGDRAYGYCEETGEEIGLKRLEARPVATLCLEAQERRELAERQYGDREDQYR